MSVETSYVIGFMSGFVIMFAITNSIFGPLMKLNKRQLERLKKGVKKCEP